MAKNSRRKRRRILAWLAALSMAVVVALVIVAVVIWIRRPTPPPRPEPPIAIPPTTGQSGPPTRPHRPRPAFQDASCPDVELISVPGTWESWPTDDPGNPTFNPNALLLNVTRPIGDQFGANRMTTYTVPYTAQFHNPFAADNQMSYNDSRAEGTAATRKALTDMNARCPLTGYVLVGFSQGAVIAGDIAGEIGNGAGPVDEDLVLGVTVIADGRRQAGIGQDIGPNPPGQGAEITLKSMPMLSTLGLTMSGPRDGGFGDLNDRVNEICAPDDLICSAPPEAFNIANLPRTLEILAGGAGQPVHALYNTPQFWNLDGQSATQWTLAWAQGVVTNAPTPPHG